MSVVRCRMECRPYTIAGPEGKANRSGHDRERAQNGWDAALLG